MGEKNHMLHRKTHVLMPSYGEINGAENLSDQELAAYMQSDAMKKCVSGIASKKDIVSANFAAKA